MLVLTRVEGERILIGDDVTIVVTRVRGGRVAIGISAPRDVAIQRAELHEMPILTTECEVPTCECGTAGPSIAVAVAAPEDALRHE